VVEDERPRQAVGVGERADNHDDRSTPQHRRSRCGRPLWRERRRWRRLRRTRGSTFGRHGSRQFIPCYRSTEMPVEARNECRENREAPGSRCWFFVFWCFVFSTFVFSWPAVVGASAAAAQIGVESLDGAAVDPFDAPEGTKAIVFIFTSTDCPISN